jgi:hypothetical protein
MPFGELRINKITESLRDEIFIVENLIADSFGAAPFGFTQGRRDRQGRQDRF